VRVVRAGKVGVGGFAAGNWRRTAMSLFGGGPAAWGALSVSQSLRLSDSQTLWLSLISLSHSLALVSFRRSLASWPPCLPGLTSPCSLLAAAATLHFPRPSTTLRRPRSAILGPPGYRRACGNLELSLAIPLLGPMALQRGVFPSTRRTGSWRMPLCTR
jgi:hypothetical protein